MSHLVNAHTECGCHSVSFHWTKLNSHTNTQWPLLSCKSFLLSPTTSPMNCFGPIDATTLKKYSFHSDHILVSYKMPSPDSFYLSEIAPYAYNYEDVLHAAFSFSIVFAAQFTIPSTQYWTKEKNKQQKNKKKICNTQENWRIC